MAETKCYVVTDHGRQKMSADCLSSAIEEAAAMREKWPSMVIRRVVIHRITEYDV